MKKMLLALAGVLMLVLGLNTAAVTPAHAGWPGGEIYHVEDDGFDDPFRLYCSSGAIWLYEYEFSKNKCADVDQISVLAGRKVVCYNRSNGTWRTFWPGVTNIGDWYSANCVHQLT